MIDLPSLIETCIPDIGVQCDTAALNWARGGRRCVVWARGSEKSWELNLGLKQKKRLPDFRDGFISHIGYLKERQITKWKIPSTIVLVADSRGAAEDGRQDYYSLDSDRWQKFYSDVSALESGMQIELSSRQGGPHVHSPVFSGGVDVFRVTDNELIEQLSEAARRHAFGAVVHWGLLNLSEESQYFVALGSGSLTTDEYTDFSKPIAMTKLPILMKSQGGIEVVHTKSWSTEGRINFYAQDGYLLATDGQTSGVLKIGHKDLIYFLDIGPPVRFVPN
jgi:hypothetical protein